MEPFLRYRAASHARPPVTPEATLAGLLADLAARMTPEQRGAFLAKMAAMDRQQGDLHAAAITLGRA